ncbi:MAG: ABC transporter permease [Streptococcus sp.]|nr:ABC transporter permease [Streptococcus sp.]
MLALVKRNFLLYFRNRSGVIFSLLGALISFILYIVFLKHNIQTAWSKLPDTNQLLDAWLIGGTLTITGLTTTFSALSRIVSDREAKVTQDLYVTDLGYWALQFSYMISSIVIGFCMQIIMFLIMLCYFIFDDQFTFDWNLVPQLLVITLLTAILSTIINAIVVNYFKSIDSLGKLATVIGAASGFLVGTYIPIGALPTFAQNIVKAFPFSYTASLFRQVLMKEKVNEAFKGNATMHHDFEKAMGIRLNLDHLLTMQETYYIVVVVLFAVVLIWFLQNAYMKTKIKTN